MRSLQVDVDVMSEVLLAGVGMSPSWCSQGEMPVFYTISKGKLVSNALFLWILYYEVATRGSWSTVHSTASESRSGSHTVVPPTTASPGPTRSAANDVVYRKVGIVTSTHRITGKRKVVQAMSRPVPEGGQWYEGIDPPSPWSSPEQLFQGSPPAILVFIPGWSLRPDSHLSVRSAALDFTRHALSPATLDEMDSMCNVVLEYNLAYTAMQAMPYFAAESRHVQRFDDLEHVNSSLVETEASLRSKVADLSAMVVRLEDENRSLVLGRLVLEDMCGVLEGQVESLTQENEGVGGLGVGTGGDGVGWNGGNGAGGSGGDGVDGSGGNGAGGSGSHGAGGSGGHKYSTYYDMNRQSLPTSQLVQSDLKNAK
ncbi:unnamed protein product [Lactuca saligna]|uniref:Uncharacterized protein n=1 Tax=Lactuca saligna TaxID=75948 RepID=A0AA35ZW33_LACSI|nr:unnamed protein product [Lactuca saligna]